MYDYENDYLVFNGDANDFDDLVAGLQSIGLENVWFGESYETLSYELTCDINSIIQQNINLKKYIKSLELIKEYTRLSQEIERLRATIPSDNDEESIRIKDMILAEINSLTNQKNALKNEILQIFSEINESNEKMKEEISYSNYADFDYICDLQNLEVDLSNIHSFANILYVLDGGQEYIDNRLNFVLSKYSGREAAVNYALMCGMLSVEAGKRIYYKNGRQNITGVPYNNSGQLPDGMDCCSGVSLWVNAGTNEQKGFQWATVGGFNNIGEENDLYIDINAALPGDVLVQCDDIKDHVVMVIDNNPENGTVTISEFTPACGLNIVTESYDSYKAYKAVNMEPYYNGDLTYKHPGN